MSTPESGAPPVRNADVVREFHPEIRVVPQGGRKWDVEDAAPSTNFPTQVAKGRFSSVREALTHLAGIGKKPDASQEFARQHAEKAKAREQELRALGEAAAEVHGLLSPQLTLARDMDALNRAHGQETAMLYGALAQRNEGIGEITHAIDQKLTDTQGDRPTIAGNIMQEIKQRLISQRADWVPTQVIVDDPSIGTGPEIDITERADVAGQQKERTVLYRVTEPSDLQSTIDATADSQVSTEHATVTPHYIIARKGEGPYEPIGLSKEVVENARNAHAASAIAYLEQQGYTNIRQIQPRQADPSPTSYVVHERTIS